MIYVLIVDNVRDFTRQQGLTIELYASEEIAHQRFWNVVAETKQHLPKLDEENGEELVLRKEVNEDECVWEVYLSGDWAFYHTQVIIRKVSLITENKNG